MDEDVGNRERYRITVTRKIMAQLICAILLLSVFQNVYGVDKQEDE